MTTAPRQKLFDQRRPAHTIIIARGDSVRHFVVKPWLATVAVVVTTSAMAGIIAGGLFAASGSVRAISDDWADGRTTAYEIRIASLRSEVDRLTTRSFVDQQKVSSKVDVLLGQQAELAQRYARLQPLLDRALSNGLLEAQVPVPEAKPNRELPATTSSAVAVDVVRTIGAAIDEAEIRQLDGLNALASRARARSEAIGSVLVTEGIGKLAPSSPSAAGEGGPYVPVPQERMFDSSFQDLATALDILQAARDATATLPLAFPVASGNISSNFGVRSDPFLRRAAMHTGVDFVAETGSPVTATGAGTVVYAGNNGGYGQMVEIDHGNGLSTRYAHLSTVLVGVGDEVEVGASVGRVGSSGRSTGPHLHYELRRAGDAIDPSRYLRAGRRISALD